MNTNSVSFFENRKSKPISGNQGLIIAVWEIDNPENVGRVIRLAHNIGAIKALFVNDNPNFRESKIKKTAGFSFNQMNWEFIAQKSFLELLKNRHELIVLETCEGSGNIYETDLPEKVILLAGSESYGVPAEIVEKGSLKIHIPMPGGCKSMNVSHALAVAAFEWYRQKIV